MAQPASVGVETENFPQKCLVVAGARASQEFVRLLNHQGDVGSVAWITKPTKTKMANKANN